MNNNSIYISFDLLELGLLPSTWKEEIVRISETKSINTILDGKSVTSRESETVKLSVHVVTGEAVQQELPWLHNLYHNELLSFASQLKEQQLVPSKSIEAGVNINVLRGSGSRYEWHVDSNPVTGLLFVTTHKDGDGGELIFKLPNEDVIVHPQGGTFIAFDAREIPHTVLPLQKSNIRISIPMNYYLSEGNQERPSDLDKYLYTQIKQQPNSL